MNNKEAFNEGEEAFLLSKSINDNPYMKTSAYNYYWEYGFSTAENDEYQKQHPELDNY